MASDGTDEMVTFRLAPRDRAGIQRLVASGEFRNRSDFLRYAVKATLAVYDELPRPKLDLDLEQVELPPNSHARDARPKGRARSNKGVNL
jgi:Arc/MetJ-type ribon-helix-helix transcriptional regulator